MDSAKNFDLKVVQQGDIYFVSGAGALMLYQKLQMIPLGARTLAVGPFKNGSFTLRKINSIPNISAAV